MGALACHPGRPQVVRPGLRGGGDRPHADGDRSPLSDGERRGTTAAARRQTGPGGGGAQGGRGRPLRGRITRGEAAMTEQTGPARSTGQAGRYWYSRSPAEVASALEVEVAAGLSASRAAELLTRNGPNALPEEKPEPGWRRFADQYRSYMQLILLAAAAVSLLIGQWTTGCLLLFLTLVNAVAGLRQEGKAESAMNALKSMMKATARVRRDGSEEVIPAEQLVRGDVVLIAAGDQVPADGRLV